MSLLGIEIGGTKLQLGLSDGQGTLSQLVRQTVDREAGAEGILQAIDAALKSMQSADISAIGVGFGGPVDRAAGRVRLSHHVAGWDDFDLSQWLRRRIDRPVTLLNDCDAAALGEARWGAGCNHRSVFYVTVGTGVGGGHVIDGQLQGQDRPAVAEIGHLRIQTGADREQIVESLCSGSGIAREANRQLVETDVDSSLRALESIRSEDVVAAAAEGDLLAQRVLQRATQTLGWAIGQVVTLLAPEIVVLGGGLSNAAPELFLRPIEDAARHHAFPPLRDSFELKKAELGDEVVVHGAIAAASD